MAYWKCNMCGNTIKADDPPDLCPSCKNACAYVDVTCYIPECGGPAADTSISGYAKKVRVRINNICEGVSDGLQEREEGCRSMREGEEVTITRIKGAGRR
jgi:rubredoxin